MRAKTKVNCDNKEILDLAIITLLFSILQYWSVWDHE